jgi:hypothetical protein
MQIDLAVREASHLEFVPPRFRSSPIVNKTVAESISSSEPEPHCVLFEVPLGKTALLASGLLTNQLMQIGQSWAYGWNDYLATGSCVASAEGAS